MALDDDLRTIATDNSLAFLIGNRHTLNLKEDVLSLGDGNVGLFLEPPRKTIVSNQFGGGVKEVVYNGHFMLIQLSDFDDGTDTDGGTDYIERKYIDNVKPLEVLLNDTIVGALRCLEYEIEQLDILPFFNLFDWNGDGISVQFKIRLTN